MRKRAGRDCPVGAQLGELPHPVGSEELTGVVILLHEEPRRLHYRSADHKQCRFHLLAHRNGSDLRLLQRKAKLAHGQVNCSRVLVFHALRDRGCRRTSSYEDSENMSQSRLGSRFLCCRYRNEPEKDSLLKEALIGG